ncbi:50S ribosomal protein L3 [Candidatus Uhrbacteria bacterium]|nr:50S ribosomal protein L3 [Candidatus Uhrbacteria bacterium]
MKFLIGKKLGMSQIFTDDGVVVPVTYIEAGPCVVTDVRTEDKDGYNAVQIGFGTTRTINKPQEARAKQLGPVRLTREARVVSVDGVKTGDIWTVGEFTVGDVVDVTGTSKGRGFAGVVKRHGFHGHNTTHGTKDQVRKSGSVGAQGPQRVFKDMRMAGHMGDERVTVKNLKVVSIDPERNTLAIRGAIPGARGGVLFIRANVTGSVWN